MKNLISYDKFNFQKIFEGFTKEEFKILEEEYKTYIEIRTKLETGYGKYIPNEFNSIKDIFLEIRNYDIEDKFKSYYKNNIFWIYPDKEFLILLKKCNSYFDFDIDNLTFYITITNMNNLYLNSIDIGDTIPEKLRSFGLAYKFYNMVLKNQDIKIITSNKYANIIMYNIWYKLMIRTDLYAFTSKFMSGVVNKDIQDNELLNILYDLKYYHNKYDFIFDKDLELKIKEFYGTMDNYK